MRKIFYKVGAALWQLGKTGAVCALLAVLLPVASARAMPQEYSILAFGVDENREKAEALSMDYARTRAMFLAANKMGVVNAEAKIKQLGAQQRAQIIRGATVEKTRREKDKTYQLIRVTVAEDQLRLVLGVKETIAATTPDAAQTRSVLVVPALVGATRMWVWEKENALRAPLSVEVMRQSRGRVMLPSGDLQDLRLIDQANAPNVKADELKPMFDRYGAHEVIIAMVSPGPDGSTDATKILLHRVGLLEIRNEVIELPPDAADTQSVRIAAAARAIASAATQIASSTAEDDRDKLASATKTAVTFVYTTPRELARLTETIRTAPHVLRLELPKIMLSNVKGVIYLEGKDTATLRKYLAAKGIVVRDIGGEWSVATR